MRLRERTVGRIGISALLVAFASLACRESNSVTGPAGGTAAASVAGAWSGTFQPGDPTGCGGSPAIATFQQSGATVTGTLATSECGVSGYFRGTMRGNELTGSINMAGCIGGAVSGTISGSQLFLSVGDLTKPLIAGEAPVMYGGAVSLHR